MPRRAAGVRFAFWIGHVNSGSDRVLVLDRFGDAVVDTPGELIDIDPQSGVTASGVRESVERNTKRLGPVTLVPTIWVIHSDTLVEIATGDVAATAAALAENADGPCAVLVSRRR